MQLAVLVLMAAPVAAQPGGEDLYEAQQKTFKAAAAKVAPSVVQIQTSGGQDVVGQVRKGAGPTTGLVVDADGYIVSSAFNFANKPTEIFVTVPGHKDRYYAKIVANDQTRMLTLLKIEAKGLPVPAPAAKKDFRVGQYSIALGRALAGTDTPPSISVGIISALDRIWGKAIQCDAKVSPVNYGGPMIDISGKVQGVLVPASPRGQDETAGVEWYDSGIGFAIPLEDINAVLPRLKKGENLTRGLLGITPQGQDIYSGSPVIGTVAPESAAAKAGLKPGDVILEIDGTKVERQAQVMHLLGKKYEGDTVSVKIKRGSEEKQFADLKLTGVLTVFAHSFMGILPMRDDPELGVEIRYVFPKSPADAAGLKAGDRIMALGVGKQGKQPFAGREGLATLLNSQPAGTEIGLDVRKKGEKNNTAVTLKLEAMPDVVPDKLPEPATIKKALEPKKTVGQAPPMPPAPPKKEDPKKVETGMLKRSNAARDHEYWVYVPENYDPNIAHAVVVWLHPVGKGKEKDAEAFSSLWEDACNDQHIILIGPRANNETGWLVSEAEFIRECLRDVASQYTVDRQRVIAHGMGSGGQLAYYLGNNSRETFRGVATVGAPLANAMRGNVANQRLAFFLISGDKDQPARVTGVAETKDKLVGLKFPVTFRPLKDRGHEYLENSKDTLQELVRWIDSLDRL
jgi:S1-C subfamily serine protease/predicted esterase